MNRGLNGGRKYETICIDRIELGINSIKSGRRSGDAVGKDLEHFFNQLEKVNKPMYDDLYKKHIPDVVNYFCKTFNIGK